MGRGEGEKGRWEERQMKENSDSDGTGVASKPAPYRNAGLTEEERSCESRPQRRERVSASTGKQEGKRLVVLV